MHQKFPDRLVALRLGTYAVCVRVAKSSKCEQTKAEADQGSRGPLGSEQHYSTNAGTAERKRQNFGVISVVDYAKQTGTSCCLKGLEAAKETRLTIFSDIQFFRVFHTPPSNQTMKPPERRRLHKGFLLTKQRPA